MPDYFEIINDISKIYLRAINDIIDALKVINIFLGVLSIKRFISRDVIQSF